MAKQRTFSAALKVRMVLACRNAVPGRRLRSAGTTCLSSTRPATPSHCTRHRGRPTCASGRAGRLRPTFSRLRCLRRHWELCESLAAVC